MTFSFFVLSIGYLVSAMDRLKEQTKLSSVILVCALFVYSIFAYKNILLIIAVVAIMECVNGWRFDGKSSCR